MPRRISNKRIASIIGTIFTLFIIHFTFFALPAAAQIIPVPGTSCDALPTETERKECRKALCPRECRDPGLTGGSTFSPTSNPIRPTCTEEEYHYSTCVLGKCIYAEDKGTGQQPPQVGPGNPIFENAPPCNYTLEDLVGAGVRVATFIFGIAGSLALLFFVYGGYQLLTAFGNPEGIQQGKKTIVGAVIGLVLILSAGFVVRFVGGLVLPRAGEGIGAGLEIPAGGVCTSDAACGAGMKCSNDVCRSRCEVEKAPEGYFCRPLACTCPPGNAKCQSPDCGPGLQCLDGGCVRSAESCAPIEDPNEKRACQSESTRGATLECLEKLCPGSEFNQCCRTTQGGGAVNGSAQTGGGGSAQTGGGGCTCSISGTAIVGGESLCNTTASTYNLNCNWSGNACNCSGSVPVQRNQCSIDGIRNAYSIPNIPGITISGSCSWQ